MDELYAHTPPPGSDEWQKLEKHLRDTAQYARQFASSFGIEKNAALASEIAYRLTLWHDLGKYSDDFQTYLRECYRLHLAGQQQRRRGPDHKAAGAYLASVHLDDYLPLIIQGHHGGLLGWVEFRNWLDDKERTNLSELEMCLQQAENEMPDMEPSTEFLLPEYLANFNAQYPDLSPAESIYSYEFFIRMIYSCLVDADSLDTERHMNHQQSNQRYARNILTDQHWQIFNQFHAELKQQGSERVSRVQGKVYQACINAACKAPGFFRLTVPTGGGKTLSGLAFALQHALHSGHQLERVIVAVPYLTITQQTTSVYRDVFKSLQGDKSHPVVLEHYSSADAFREDENDESGDADPLKVWHRLAAENWDAPVIVTTTVQLFESMFARKRSRCRKLHNLAKSVIILDEAQSLPVELLAPILSGLRELVDYYGSTVVFSTATQPEFNLISNVNHREIVDNYTEHFDALKRVHYDWRTDTPCEWSDVANWMLVQPQQQALAVVNTKQDAHALLNALAHALKEKQSDVKPLHLSTLLCGTHRDYVLQQIFEKLQNGKPCLLVSTQVVEAGVDLDFPLVLRALGPLSSIVQAAGRCNRKDNLDSGHVIIFRPREGGEPSGVPKLARQVTEALYLRGNLDPKDPSSFGDYYKRLFAQIDPDRKKIQELRQSFEYREVAEKFKIIPDDTIALVVRYSAVKDEEIRQAELERIDAWLDELMNRRGQARTLLRQLQPYMVNLFRWKALPLQNHFHKGSPVVELIGDETSNIGVWNGEYDDTRGLIVPEGIGLDQLVA